MAMESVMVAGVVLVVKDLTNGMRLLLLFASRKKARLTWDSWSTARLISLHDGGCEPKPRKGPPHNRLTHQVQIWCTVAHADRPYY
jgi:hypothetical protein